MWWLILTWGHEHYIYYGGNVGWYFVYASVIKKESEIIILSVLAMCLSLFFSSDSCLDENGSVPVKKS